LKTALIYFIPANLFRPPLWLKETRDLRRLCGGRRAIAVETAVDSQQARPGELMQIKVRN